MSNDKDSVLGFRPSAELRQRLEFAKTSLAKSIGCMPDHITWQILLPSLLNEAMDARGVPEPDCKCELVCNCDR